MSYLISNISNVKRLPMGGLFYSQKKQEKKHVNSKSNVTRWR
nr:MAG TPA_asm: hypothetical protein [Caudoviricetes sp.]